MTAKAPARVVRRKGDRNRGLEKTVREVLSHPMELPDEFKRWLKRYLEVNPPRLLFSDLATESGRISPAGVDLTAATSLTPSTDRRVRWVREADGIAIAEVFGGENADEAYLWLQSDGSGTALERAGTYLYSKNKDGDSIEVLAQTDSTPGTLGSASLQVVADDVGAGTSGIVNVITSDDKSSFARLTGNLGKLQLQSGVVKGDIQIGSATDVMSRLAVGSNGMSPIADSAQSMGYRNAYVLESAAGAAGKINYGTQSVTGDGTVAKDVTFNHGLGTTPTIVVGNTDNAGLLVGIQALTGTQITLRIRNVTGAGWSLTATVYWMAIG